MKKLLVLSLLATLVATAAAQAPTKPAPASSPAPNALKLPEAQGWSRHMRSLERVADRRFFQAYRDHTLLHPEINPVTGAPHGGDLTGMDMWNFIEKMRGQRKAVGGGTEPQCQWYPGKVPTEAVELCVGTIAPEQSVTKAALTYYTYGIAEKDAEGFFYKELWLSTRKLF